MSNRLRVKRKNSIKVDKGDGKNHAPGTKAVEQRQRKELSVKLL
jgi:hypothetical protein